MQSSLQRIYCTRITNENQKIFFENQATRGQRRFHLLEGINNLRHFQVLVFVFSPNLGVGDFHYYLRNITLFYSPSLSVNVDLRNITTTRLCFFRSLSISRGSENLLVHNVRVSIV